MNTRLPGFILLFLAAALPARAQAQEPYLKWFNDKNVWEEGFPAEETIHLEGSLGAHDLKWSDIVTMNQFDGTVRVTLSDASTVSGKLQGATIKVVHRDGTAGELVVKELRRLSVERAARPPKPPQILVKPLARGVSAFRCGGMATGEDGTIVATDRGVPAIVLFDGKTLVEKSRSKLDAEPHGFARVPGALQALMIVPGGLSWVDLKTGSVAETMKLGIEFNSMAALSPDLAAASGGDTMVVVSRKAGGVIDRLTRRSPSIFAAPAPDMLLTSEGLYWVDPLATGKLHMVLSAARAPAWQQGSDGVFSPDGRYAVDLMGNVARLGRGTGAFVVDIGKTLAHSTGFFSPDAKKIYLFTQDLFLVVFETETWTEVRRLQTGFHAWKALPTDDGKAAILLGAVGAQRRDPTRSDHFGQAGPAELLKISLEE